ncbi:Vitamin B12 import ATP-binding protein BtuD [Paraburkholderia domus]|uniref:ATP-binding cassette domain-containing protein n=1 Tax=Paraburkholderia domus TaxID=2793075 RepID=UPI001911B067|nr:ATP-binding cassette domain-containing protein [Paraburkholderia domus]MBK5091274.1 ATP-binding cassette domain-containing protein [Burkholderia sp. R-69927]CAE6931390.1 Vitamin B12 import ATP-binding protein BtuD [Paraburkholderia domus]
MPEHRTTLFALVSLLITGTLLHSSGARADTLDDIKSRGTMTVAIDPNFAPYEYTDANNNIVGYDPAIMAAVAKHLGVKIEFQRMARLEASDLAVEALRQVGLSGKHTATPANLSGGQQQRVGIARTLAMAPEIILFDEPTSALDPELVGEVLTVMRGLAAKETTMIVVTHESGFARDVADRVIFMDGGRIVEQGPTAQVLDTPSSPRLQQFLLRFTPENSRS